MTGRRRFGDENADFTCRYCGTYAYRRVESSCWDKTKELLAPDVDAWVTNTQPRFARTVEFAGIDEYMLRKVKGAQLVEPGSIQVVAIFGDESNALILVTFGIGLGPGGSMVTMARACLYSLDENKKIKEERDEFLVLSP